MKVIGCGLFGLLENVRFSLGGGTETLTKKGEGDDGQKR